jgi:WD40 repeat protein
MNSANISWDNLFIVTSTSGGANSKVQVWAPPLKIGGDLRLLSTLKHKDDVQYAEFSPKNSSIVVTASYDNTAAIWNWTKCDQREGANEDACEDLPKFLLHDDALRMAAFTFDGSRIVTQSLDNRVQVWDAVTGQSIGGRIPHRGNVNSVGVSRDGHRILTSSEGAGAQVWELDDPGIGSGKPIEPGGFVALGVVQTTAGLRIIGIDGENLRMLDSTGAYVNKSIPVGDSDAEVIAAGCENSPNGCWYVLRYKTTYQPDGKTVAGYVDAQDWDFRTGKPIGPPLTGSGAIDLSPDGKRILVSSGNTESIFDATTGKAQGHFTHDGILGHSFSPDSSRVISEYFGGAQLWDTDSGKPIGNEMKHGGAVNDAEFSADGKRVATASDDRTAQVWDAFTGEPIGSPLQHAGIVVSAQFSPDPGGTYVMTEVKNGLSQGLMQVWDVQTGRRKGAPIHIANTRAAPYFSPDGKMVVTSNSVSAQLWDTRTGKPIGEPIGLGEDVYAASFSTDGREIEVTSRTGGGYYRMHMYRLAPAPGDAGDSKLMATLAEAVGGYMIDEKTGAADVSGPDKRFASLQQLRKEYKIPDKESILHYFGTRLTGPIPDKR